MNRYLGLLSLSMVMLCMFNGFAQAGGSEYTVFDKRQYMNAQDGVKLLKAFGTSSTGVHRDSNPTRHR